MVGDADGRLCGKLERIGENTGNGSTSLQGAQEVMDSRQVSPGEAIISINF